MGYLENNITAINRLVQLYPKVELNH